jgi:hypothetical protein
VPWYAVTAASHAVLVIASLLLVFEVIAAIRIPGALERIGRSRLTLRSFFVVIAALVVERSFYVAARVVQHKGLRLSDLHPAPDVLSVALAVSIFLGWAAAARAVRGSTRAVARYVGGVAAILAGLWAALILVAVGAA